jgi:hypothetical protein
VEEADFRDRGSARGDEDADDEEGDSGLRFGLHDGTWGSRP